MKINFVVHSFDKSRLGGVLKVVTTLANNLAAFNDKYEVSIISLGRIDNYAFPLSEKVKLKVLGLEKFDTTFYKSWRKIFWFFQSYFLLKTFIANEKDAIWISSSQPLTILFSLLKTKNNILFGCEHAATTFRNKSFYQKIKLFLYKRLNQMIALTPEDHWFYIKNNISSELIPNGVERSNLEHNKRNKVVFIGRFCDEKSPVDAVRNFSNSSLNAQGFELVMYGEGKLHDDVQGLIDKLGINAKIVSNENDPRKMLDGAACLIMTSKTECFPTVLLEAISNNVPCISFDCEFGPRNIINEENGFLINMDDHQSFSNKLDIERLTPFWNRDISNSINHYYIQNILIKWTLLFDKYIK